MLSYNEYFEIIAFQLTGRIVVVRKSTKAVLGCCKNMLGFSYLAIPTRHEVSIKPHLHDYISYCEKTNPQNLKDCKCGENNLWAIAKR